MNNFNKQIFARLLSESYNFHHDKKNSHKFPGYFQYSFSPIQFLSSYFAIKLVL